MSHYFAVIFYLLKFARYNKLTNNKNQVKCIRSCAHGIEDLPQTLKRHHIFCYLSDCPSLWFTPTAEPLTQKRYFSNLLTGNTLLSSSVFLLHRFSYQINKYLLCFLHERFMLFTCLASGSRSFRFLTTFFLLILTV